jgi:hypothetical protein
MPGAFFIGKFMAVRFYLLPLEQIGNGRGPKYLTWRNHSGLDARWAVMSYGLIGTALVMADVTSQQHNTLIANSDVTAIPQNIDANITTGALSAVRSALEGLRIPGNWATTANTYRELLRMVGGLFQFAQRHHGLHNQIIIPENINLDMTWGDIPLTWRQNLQTTADSFGYDYSQVTGSTPVRAILKSLADQWGNQPLYIGGVEL